MAPQQESVTTPTWLAPGSLAIQHPTSVWQAYQMSHSPLSCPPLPGSFLGWLQRPGPCASPSLRATALALQP